MISVLDGSYTFIFVLEMVCKLVGVGPKLYLADSFNILDSFIVIMSVIDFILMNTVLDRESGGRVFNAIIAFRILRVLRLARIWKQFKRMLT